MLPKLFEANSVVICLGCPGVHVGVAEGVPVAVGVAVGVRVAVGVAVGVAPPQGPTDSTAVEPPDAAPPPTTNPRALNSAVPGPW